jgi:hypothetical protein
MKATSTISSVVPCETGDNILKLRYFAKQPYNFMASCLWAHMCKFVPPIKTSETILMKFGVVISF